MTSMSGHKGPSKAAKQRGWAEAVRGEGYDVLDENPGFDPLIVPRLIEAARYGRKLQGKVLSLNKGGAQVGIYVNATVAEVEGGRSANRRLKGWVPGFCPYSKLGVAADEYPDDFVGGRFHFRIMNKQPDELIVERLLDPKETPNRPASNTSRTKTWRRNAHGGKERVIRSARDRQK